ncbi:MAG: EscU/YscU/HrcU family type III secretion system export apparatus switch protein [Alphaproteobacteria bacterium]|nr:EscU/YscU/HrcU family type III secretion system export apparatus switch protein [Alphaproteobacteria bacterium]
MSETDNSKNPQKNNVTPDFSTTDYAVALQYNKDQHDAPIVTAKGEGEIAAKIISLAQENNIEIRQDADLLQILKTVNINEEIPLEAFAAVAEILSFIYSQNKS